MSVPRTLLDMPRRNGRIYLGIFAASVALLGMAAYWNWFAPAADYYPTLVSDVLTIVPAVGAAIAATLLLRQFDRVEKPYMVWFWLSLGWWAWVLGEICSFGYDMFRIPYGELSVYDIFWTLGYACFGLSVFFQYRSIYTAQVRKTWLAFLPFVLLTLLVTLGLTQWALAAGLGEGLSWFALYLAVFYPVCDVVIGVTALGLAFVFGRGAWGRPWWGLIVFAVADGINIFLWIGGDKVLRENVSSFLDSLSSTIYNAGYLAAMLGFFFILLLNFWNGSLQQNGTAGEVK